MATRNQSDAIRQELNGAWQPISGAFNFSYTSIAGFPRLLLHHGGWLRVLAAPGSILWLKPEYQVDGGAWTDSGSGPDGLKLTFPDGKDGLVPLQCNRPCFSTAYPAGTVINTRVMAKCSGSVVLCDSLLVPQVEAVKTWMQSDSHQWNYAEDDPVPVVNTIAAMNASSYVLVGDTLKDTGHNFNGHLGLGDNTNRNVFTAVAGTGWSRLFGASNGNAVTAFAIKADGSLWGAGENSRGQLGIVGDTADKNVFLELTWPTDTIIDIAISSHVVVLLANGDVYTAGWNDVGQLGLGDTANRDGLGFEKVAGKYRAVAVGQKFTILLGQDGSLYGFGQNTSGQLGTGDFVNVYSPTLLPISDAAKFSCRNARTAVIKSDGTLWFAGQNPVTFENVNTWTQQESGADWVETFSPQHFLRSDGSLWVIGTNTSGELGLGHTTSPVSVMTQVGTDTDWEHVSVGLAHSIAKKGGNLMRWGYNNLGQLGTGGIGTVLSPQVFTV